jgi:streptogramin lyase
MKWFTLLTLWLSLAAAGAAPKISVLETGELANPYGMAIGPDGALYVCDIGKHRIRRIDLKSGRAETVAGRDGQKGFSGEGGPAREAVLDEPYEVRFDREGNLYFVDMPNAVVERVDRKSGVLTRVAGTGQPGFGGDGGPAAKAQLRQPHSIAMAPDGALLICDTGNHRVRKVDLKTGIIETYAGTGEKAATPDGSPIGGTPLNGPRAIDFDRDGTLWLALREGNAIYRGDLKKGQWQRAAGTGEKGYTGDGGDPRAAKLSGPKGVACGRDGAVFIADTENHVIREIGHGVIRTLVGTGSRGGGIGAGIETGLARPHGVLAGIHGELFIADSENNRILVER